MKYLITAAVALAAPATAAQHTAPAAAPAVASAEPDPERLAIATAIAAQTFPDGTFQKVMAATMNGPSGSAMDSVLDMQMGDLASADGPVTADEQQRARRTMRELMLAEDPHFTERMQITQRVMSTEMGALMTNYEPAMREALAKAYARRFTVEQLTDLQRFFSSPTGRTFAVESFTLASDPELVKSMHGFAPDLIKRMPAIMAKMEAATAHLPPPPAPEKASRRKKRR